MQVSQLSSIPNQFRRTSNHVPEMDEPSTPVQFAKSATIIQQIVHLEHYYEAKVQAGSLRMRPREPVVHFGMKY